MSESGASATVTTDVEIDRRLWHMGWGSKLGVGVKAQVRIRAEFLRVS